MPDAVKVYRTAAFEGLASEIKRFGTLPRQEAHALFGKELVTNALLRKVCAERKTKVGKLLYLLHQGRKLAGVTGSFTPTDDALMDAACLRQAGLGLERAGVAIQVTARGRRKSIIYEQQGGKVLVLAQHAGYTYEALRRLYRELVETGEYRELHLYTYLDAESLGKLARPVLEPGGGSRPADPQRLHLHRLDPAGSPAERAKSAVN